MWFPTRIKNAEQQLLLDIYLPHIGLIYVCCPTGKKLQWRDR